jgi:HEAT repeat protein
MESKRWRSTKQAVVSILLLCSLGTLFSGCLTSSCETAWQLRPVEALIGQLQGRCCLYRPSTLGNSPCKQFSEDHHPGRHLCVSWAAECLSRMGTEGKEAIPALIQALETGPSNYNTGDGVTPTRTDIIIALGTIGDERAVKPLLKALRSPRRTERSLFAPYSTRPLEPGYDGSIRALGLLGPVAKEAVPELIPFLQKTDESRPRAAAEALARIQDPRAIPPLIEALQNPNVRSFAADALGKFGSKAQAAVPVMIDLFARSPDIPGTGSLIDAITEIQGSTPFDKEIALYRKAQSQMWKELTEIVKAQDEKGLLVIKTFEQEEYYVELKNGKRLHVSFARSLMNIDREAGELWLEKNDRKIWQTRFTTLTQMRQLFKDTLIKEGGPVKFEIKQKN